MKKIILDLCGGTGSWSKPYKDAGYEVILITLPDWDVTAWKVEDGHIIFEGNNFNIKRKISDIYGVFAAPPCTKFSRASWNLKKKDRDFKEGMKCVKACMNIIWAIQEHAAPLKFWALENPQGYLRNFMGIPAYYFQPWQFGDTSYRATKRNNIWGYFNLPVKTKRIRKLHFISPRTSKRDKVDKLRENTGWYKASASD